MDGKQRDHETDSPEGPIRKGEGVVGSGLCIVDRPFDIPHDATIDPEIFTVECWVKASTRVEIVSRDEIWSKIGDWSIVYDYPRQRLEFMTQINGGLDKFFWSPDNSLVADEVI